MRYCLLLTWTDRHMDSGVLVIGSGLTLCVRNPKKMKSATGRNQSISQEMHEY